MLYLIMLINSLHDYNNENVLKLLQATISRIIVNKVIFTNVVFIGGHAGADSSPVGHAGADSSPVGHAGADSSPVGNQTEACGTTNVGTIRK